VTIDLARWRVRLGFAVAAVSIAFARPTPASLAAGAAVALAGEALRMWAAGHLEKSREVTSSGPYRWMRHPLYLGSTIIGAGFAIAASRTIVTGFVLLYLALTLTAAVRKEERFLHAQFEGGYEAYRRGRTDASRRFSLARARRNGEHRAVAGLLVMLAVLWLRGRLTAP
jgi:protein-S-isoprenylcysteine O-methyltransferase Ste14